MVQLGFLRTDTPHYLWMSVALSEDGNGGALAAHIENVDGKRMGDFRKAWRVGRDNAGLPDWTREVAQHFLYGLPHDLPSVAYVSMERHLPRLDAVGRAVGRPT